MAPGRVLKDDGTPYWVFTPFSRRWAEHGWRGPIDPPRDVTYLTVDGTTDLPDLQRPDGLELPPAGETAARRRWQAEIERRTFSTIYLHRAKRFQEFEQLASNAYSRSCIRHMISWWS